MDRVEQDMFMEVRESLSASCRARSDVGIALATPAECLRTAAFASRGWRWRWHATRRPAATGVASTPGQHAPPACVAGGASSAKVGAHSGISSDCLRPGAHAERLAVAVAADSGHLSAGASGRPSLCPRAADCSSLGAAAGRGQRHAARSPTLLSLHRRGPAKWGVH